MRTHRSISAALTLTLALTLAACDGGEAEGPASAGSTAEEGATTTAPQDAGQTETGSPAEPADATDDDGDDDDAATGTGDPEETGAEETDDDDDDGAADQTSAGEATESDDDTDDDGQDDDSDGVVGGGPAADLTPSGLAAIETALAEVDGTAYEVDDREDGFWEVDVMTEDGGVEVTVAPDGTTVDGTADDADDALEDAGRRALAGARVSLAEAIVAAVRASEGQLDSAGLAEQDGGWWWRVVVDSADADDIELRIDPVTAEVVADAG